MMKLTLIMALLAVSAYAVKPEKETNPFGNGYGSLECVKGDKGGKSICVKESKDADTEIDKVFLGCQGGLAANDCNEQFKYIVEYIGEDCEGDKCKQRVPMVQLQECKGFKQSVLKLADKEPKELKSESKFLCVRVHDPEAEFGITAVEGEEFPRKVCMRHNEGCTKFIKKEKPTEPEDEPEDAPEE